MRGSWETRRSRRDGWQGEEEENSEGCFVRNLYKRLTEVKGLWGSGFGLC